MKRFLRLYIFLLLICGGTSYAQVRLPRLISDGVILQRDTKLKIRGWAAPSESIKLSFKGKTYRAKADKDGNWLVMLPSQPAGGPFEMVFSAKNVIKVHDVMFGDVWVCSGQSNMVLTMDRVKEIYPDIISNSENDQIRQFLVPEKYDFKKAHSDFDGGSWISADPETIPGFSAVAYFFAKGLYEQYHVPVGIINSALGGSPVEAWMSEDALKKFPQDFHEYQRFKNDSLIAAIEAGDHERSEIWHDELNRKDMGLLQSPKWYEAGLDDRDWDRIQVPGYWADYKTGPVNGAVWFRKEINLPGSMEGRPAKLWLGRIVDQDSVYINGKLVGTTGYQYPPRRYSVAPGILKTGKNTLSVRVINNSGRGGFVPDKPYYLAAGNDTVDLKGTWKYKPGAAMKPLAGQTFIRWKPGGLYNRMIAPLLNFNIKGVVWYQGESNERNPQEYGSKLQTMINDWRSKWDQGNFPFIYVQLPNYRQETPFPSESSWAELRQSQLNTLKIENTGMAVTIDLGEWNDVHPLDKEDVGKRLVLLARKLAYHENEVAAFSPVPDHAGFEEEKVMITFRNAGNGLKTKDGGPVQYFAISGDGRNFIWAKAMINGNVVTVWNDKIKNPVKVRYAWADNPDTANLISKDGLPASPFEIDRRSDDSH